MNNADWITVAIIMALNALVFVAIGLGMRR